MLFGKKKKEDSNFDLDVPDFHDEHQNSQAKPVSMPKFPSFDHEFGTIKKEIGKPVSLKPQVNIPKKQESIPIQKVVPPTSGKPIFVKLESYKEAMENVNKIKNLCREADTLLDQIHKIRSEEDRELENWHRDLNKIKDRLLDVDRTLFES